MQQMPFEQSGLEKNYNCFCFRFGRKKSIIIAMIIAFIASVISVGIPTNKSSGKSVGVKGKY